MGLVQGIEVDWMMPVQAAAIDNAALLAWNVSEEDWVTLSYY